MKPGPVSIRSLFKPCENRFVKLLQGQASLALKGMGLLKASMDEQIPLLP
jgi:hypothetical protein